MPKKLFGRLVVLVLLALLVAGCTSSPRQDLVAPKIPVTPSVETLMGTLEGNTRSYALTASAFVQKIANFPISTATVWGYNGSTPGPTLIAYEGEGVKVVVTNQLPVPTTVHFHGMHEPNEDDGVPGISQPKPIMPGESYTYEFVPGHTGTFAYHSHTDSGVQELRGLDGFFIILPGKVSASEQVDKDFAMTLQEFSIPEEGALVVPFPPMGFSFFTINGKTGDASGGTLEIEEGDRVRVRLYNASQDPHAMHLHGHDFTVVSKNGHPITPENRNEVTTVNVAPGDFVELEFVATNPGNWIFHCHFPHHTANKTLSGFEGAPVGMTRIFHYKGYKPVPQEYFDYTGAG